MHVNGERAKATSHDDLPTYTNSRVMDPRFRQVINHSRIVELFFSYVLVKFDQNTLLRDFPIIVHASNDIAKVAIHKV